MAELIVKSEAKEIMTEDWFLDILLTQYGRHDIKEEVENAIDRIPPTTEAEIREKAIDDFAEYLKEIARISAKCTCSQSDGYSQIMRICEAIAEQLKEE